jgi:protein-S-isoprenylcysteine O-methyltransferase Ste14
VTLSVARRTEGDPRRLRGDIVVRMAAEVPDRPPYPIPAPGVELAPIVALALIVILSLVAPVSFLPLGVSLAVGIPLLVVGVGLFGWAQASILGAGENPAPHRSTARLVTGGAFRLSRNPIYTGGTTGLFGLAVLLDTATGLAVAVLLGLLARSVALAEERYLDAKFGDEYRDYRARVRRWI